MRGFIRFIVEVIKKEEGPTAVEYAVMLALIIAVCVGAIATLGNKTTSVYADPTLKEAVSPTGSS